MRRPLIRRLLAGLLLPAVCCACGTTAVPVVKEAIKCDASPALLAACGEPSAIKPGITFGELIEVSARDRESFRACALRQKSLADAVASCNASIEKYNAEIRELNARNAAP
jgi:hypothetical protein